MSSLRKQGPIRRGVCFGRCCSTTFAQPLRPVVMGPCFLAGTTMIGLRRKRSTDFARRANQRGFARLPCPAPFAKIFLFFRTQITPITRAVLPHTGAYRGRHGRGVGCGGRGSVGRNGIAGRIFRERSLRAQTRDVAADGEVVWS
jgi:hypothetical protein